MRDTCFLCGSKKYHTIHKGVRNSDAIDVLKCEECGLVRLSDNVAGDDYYIDSTMRQNETEESIDQIRIATRCDDIRRYKFTKTMIENRKVLDFGCGAGGYLCYAKQDVKGIYGVELETAMRDKINTEGIKCFANIEEAVCELQGRIDIVTMFHVLEHIDNPEDILEKLKRLLCPDGRMIIEIPNSDDVLLSLFENKSFADFTYWESHLYLYNNTTFRQLMDKSKLNIEFLGQIQRYPLSNTLYWLAKGKPGGHREWAMLSNERLDREYENQMTKLGIADTIIAIVRPRR